MLKIEVMESICRIGRQGNDPNDAVRASPHPTELPPFYEQQAIVNKVEKLLVLCDQLETQITQNQAHAEQLMQAVLREAFGHNREAALRSV